MSTIHKDGVCGKCGRGQEENTRARILPKTLNTEVEQYLERNGTVIVSVGMMELHGGFPLDSETVISETFALRMAEAAGGLVLTGLPCFYAGATAMARGTTQVSMKEGIDYLGAIARSLLRQGFKRQIYISFHGPARMTYSPVVRDFFDETGVPILYMNLTMQMVKEAKDLFKSLDVFHATTMAAYDIMGRLGGIPLAIEYPRREPQTVERSNELFGLAYQSRDIGYCFGDQKDHMNTAAVPTEERYRKLAEEGRPVIEKIVNRIHMEKAVADIRDLEKFQMETMKKYPWMPAAYNREKQEPDAQRPD